MLFEEDKRPFIYMRHFRATYTQYCIKHSLEPVQSRDEIIRQRELVIPCDSPGLRKF